MESWDRRPSRLAALPLAILFLIETWIWRKLVAFASFCARALPWAQFRDWAKRHVDRAPAIVAVLLFGIPLAVSEGGAFVSVVLMATGRVYLGMALYVSMKIFGLLLVPAIFEITRNKLLALPWFAWAYGKFEALHAAVRRFVAPYREAARESVASLWRWARGFVYGRADSAARASAAKAATPASSARAVGSSPASPSH